MEEQGPTKKEFDDLKYIVNNHKHQQFDQTQPLGFLSDSDIGVSIQAYDAELTQIAGLADPNADRILFWDDSAGEMKYLSLGTGLSITDTTINGGGVDYQVFTSNGTWTKPAGATASSYTLIQIWGGGGSGAANTNSGNTMGGGGGGAYVEVKVPTSSLNSTETVVVGATKSGDSNDGETGNQSSFKTYIAYGGGGGVAASGTGSGGPGGGGGGSLGSGLDGGNPGGNSYGGNGGDPLGGIGAFESTGPSNSGFGGGAGGGGAAKAGGFSAYGGGGGGGGGYSAVSNNGGAGGNSISGGGGGGGGARIAGTGGTGGVSTFGGAGGAGGAQGVSGSAGTAPGGGGGAAGQNSGPTLNGGDGARGEVRVFTFI